MERAFKNTLSWSTSRAETLIICKRKYYLQYYRYWNGWKPDADPLAQRLYFLKKLKFANMWIGIVVHRSIKYAIENIQSIKPNVIKQYLSKRIEMDFKKSSVTTYSTINAK